MRSRARANRRDERQKVVRSDGSGCFWPATNCIKDAHFLFLFFNMRARAPLHQTRSKCARARGARLHTFALENYGVAVFFGRARAPPLDKRRRRHQHQAATALFWPFSR